MKVNPVLKTREKIAYGLGDMGNNIAYGAVGFYFLFFLTDVAGLSPIWAGYIFMVVRIWNAISDLIMGSVSDRTHSKFGRRRPFLLYGSIPLAIAFSLLWVVPFKGEWQLILYYTLIGIVFNTLYSVVSIPYNALLPEMSQDYNERTSISGYKMAFSFIGSLFAAMGVTLIVDAIYPGKSSYIESYPVMGKILAAILMLCILASFLGTKERVKNTAENKGSLWAHLKSLLQLNEFRLVLGVFIFNMVAFDIIMALYIYFMKYALKISDDLSYIFMAIPLVTAVVFTPMWVKISDKIGKQKTYIIAAFYFLIPLLSCLFVPAGNLFATACITIFIGVGISASQVLIFSILPDVVEVDELKNGVRREGIIYGVTMFIYKMSSGVFVAIATAALGWIGYVESKGGLMITQSSEAIFGIRLLMSCLPSLCLLISILFIRKLKIEKHTFDDIKKSLEIQS